MTDSCRVDEIRQRLKAATPGEWKCWNAFTLAGQTRLLGIARIGPCGADGGGGLMGNTDGKTGADLYATAADAQFIANAPSDLAYLLGLLQEKESVLVQLQQEAARMAAQLANYERMGR